MAKIRAFKAIRPNPDLTDKIAALPYDVYNREEARQVALSEPLSFLNIDRPETQFAPDYDMYAPEVYEKAKEMLNTGIGSGNYIEDKSAGYYLYELTMNGRKQTGIVAVASIDDYINGIIKKHENTREEKEQDRIRHIDVCSMQTGPIFLAYRKNDVITEVVNTVKQGAPIFDFVSSDGIGHKGWAIFDKELTDKIYAAFEGINQIYIADGHHRAASAVKVGLKRRKENPDYTGDEEFNYFLSVLFPDEELMIMDYNRAVKDLNGYTENEFLNKVNEKFTVTESSVPVSPAQKSEVGMFLGDKWYKLTVKPQYQNRHPVDGLDVSVLQNELLAPVLGIADPRTDTRIDFIGGIRGLTELERRVKSDSKVAFSMCPTSISELFDVADAALLMPPKSTWFEPKLRSGLFIHRI